jgi:hypothetical protein
VRRAIALLLLAGCGGSGATPQDGGLPDAAAAGDAAGPSADAAPAGRWHAEPAYSGQASSFSFALDAGGVPHLSLYRPGDGAHLYLSRGGDGWTSEPFAPSEDSFRRQDDDQSFLAFDAAGGAWIGYATNGPFMIARREGGGWSWPFLVNHGYRGTTSLSWDSGGQPVLLTAAATGVMDLSFAPFDAEQTTYLNGGALPGHPAPLLGDGRDNLIVFGTVNTLCGVESSLVVVAFATLDDERDHCLSTDLHDGAPWPSAFLDGGELAIAYVGAAGGLHFGRDRGWSPVPVDAEATALSPQGAAPGHIVYTAGEELRLATLGPGGWTVERIGAPYHDAQLAVDDSGAPHIAAFGAGGIVYLR